MGGSNRPPYDNIIKIPRSYNDDIRVGQIFFSKHDLSVKLSILTMRNNFDYRVIKLTKSLLTVRCLMKECKCRFLATRMDESDLFIIKQYLNENTRSL